jgi:hypothetical protein
MNFHIKKYIFVFFAIFPACTQEVPGTSSSDKIHEYLSRCMTSPDRLLDMETIAKDVSRLMTQIGITHWLDSGTLIGAYRFGSHMPFDDDVDFGVLESDYLKHKALLEEQLNSLGYETKFHPNAKIYQIYFKLDSNRAQVDLFLFKPMANSNRLRLVSDTFHPYVTHGDGQPGFRTDLIFKDGNLSKGILLGVSFPIPANPKGYLNQWYPEPSIMTNFMVTQTHATGFCKDNSVKILDILEHPEYLQKMLAHLELVYGSRFDQVSVPLLKVSAENL